MEIKRKDGTTRRFHMPSRAHLMVDDGQEVMAGDVLAKIPRETTKTKDITGGLRASSSCSRRASPATGDHERDRRRGEVRRIVKGRRKVLIVPESQAESREYEIPRGVPSASRKASPSGPASR